MKSGTRAALYLIVSMFVTVSAFAEERAFVEILKTQIRANGFQPAGALYQNRAENLVEIANRIELRDARHEGLNISVA